MEEIFTHITTKEDCDSFIEEVRIRRVQLELKYSKAEAFIERISEGELNYTETFTRFKNEHATVISLLDENLEEETRDKLQMKRLRIEWKLIKLEQVRRRHSKYSIALKHLDMQQFQLNIQFLNKVLKHAQKRSSEL